MKLTSESLVVQKRQLKLSSTIDLNRYYLDKLLKIDKQVAFGSQMASLLKERADIEIKLSHIESICEDEFSKIQEN